MKGADYDLLLWILANANADGRILESWKRRASKELNLHYVTVLNATQRLVKHGVIEARKHQQGVKIKPEAFDL